jgi:lysophospholipase L1-like esterase
MALRSKLAAWLRRALLWTLLLALPVLLVELGLRIYQRATLGIPVFQFGLSGPRDGGDDPNTAVVSDPRLGWRPSAGWRFHGPTSDSDGASHTITVTQHEHGLRSFGDTQAKRPKVLAIGDSFSQAVCVADGETYYDQLGKQIGAEIFGGGTSGWGTLQESMFLDDLIDRIHPDVIVWQFTNNDFMDNDFDLGKRWRAGCQTLVRPYLDDGNIVYRYSCHGRWATWSRLGYLITTRLDRMRAPAPGEDELVNEIIRVGREHAGFRAAMATTSAIFDRVRARVGATPVVLFHLGTTADPFASAARELALAHGFHFVDSLPAALDLAKRRGDVVLCADGIHYNAAGHRIMAEALVRQFAADHLPPSR